MTSLFCASMPTFAIGDHSTCYIEAHEQLEAMSSESVSMTALWPVFSARPLTCVTVGPVISSC